MTIVKSEVAKSFVGSLQFGHGIERYWVAFPSKMIWILKFKRSGEHLCLSLILHIFC